MLAKTMCLQSIWSGYGEPFKTSNASYFDGNHVFQLLKCPGCLKMARMFGSCVWGPIGPFYADFLGHFCMLAEGEEGPTDVVINMRWVSVCNSDCPTGVHLIIYQPSGNYRVD